jgi:hypothetical protein
MTRALLTRLALSLSVLIGAIGACRSETVDVKYRGPVDLSPFKCESIDQQLHSAGLLRCHQQLYDRAAQPNLLSLL